MKLNRVYIGVASNVQPAINLVDGIRLMHTWFNIIAVSPVYESLPVGGSPDDPIYLNAVIYIETYTYLELLRKRLKGLERLMGRVRQETSEGLPQGVTLDLDILLFNNETDYSVITPLPHPDLTRYAHAAVPLADLAPDLRHPITGETLAVIAARFRDTPGLKRRDDVILPTA